MGWYPAPETDDEREERERPNQLPVPIPQPPDAPVAWMMKWHNHSPSFTTDKSDYVTWFNGKAHYPEELIPLYTHPATKEN